jgi:hypothetical protein
MLDKIFELVGKRVEASCKRTTQRHITGHTAVEGPTVCILGNLSRAHGDVAYSTAYAA